MAETATPPGTELTEEGLVEEPQVVVVESTNSLLVNATPEQHAKIASIIEYVDSEMDLEEIPYKIYPLENSSPDHLAEVLESLIQETIEQQDKDGKIEKVVTKRRMRDHDRSRSEHLLADRLRQQEEPGVDLRA